MEILAFNGHTTSWHRLDVLLGNLVQDVSFKKISMRAGRWNLTSFQTILKEKIPDSWTNK